MLCTQNDNCSAYRRPSPLCKPRQANKFYSILHGDAEQARKGTSAKRNKSETFALIPFALVPLALIPFRACSVRSYSVSRLFR